MRNLLVSGLLLSFGGLSMAAMASLEGTVALIRTITYSHPTADARGGTLFKMNGNNGASIAPPCVWFFLAEGDKNALSALLVAKTSASDIGVHYETTGTTTWGGSSICQVQNLDLL